MSLTRRQDHIDIRLISSLTRILVGSTGKFCAPVCASVSALPVSLIIFFIRRGHAGARPPWEDIYRPGS